jgi:hypothetical protein
MKEFYAVDKTHVVRSALVILAVFLSAAMAPADSINYVAGSYYLSFPADGGSGSQTGLDSVTLNTPAIPPGSNPSFPGLSANVSGAIDLLGFQHGALMKLQAQVTSDNNGGQSGTIAYVSLGYGDIITYHGPSPPATLHLTFAVTGSFYFHQPVFAYGGGLATRFGYSFSSVGFDPTSGPGTLDRSFTGNLPQLTDQLAEGLAEPDGGFTLGDRQ